MIAAPSALTCVFPRGEAVIRLFGEDLPTGSPVALLFMDAFGPRPELFGIADRIASHGWRVMLPDLFYDHQPFPPLDPASILSGGEDRGRMMAMVGALDQAKVDADVTALLDLAEERFGAVPLGAIGYCMGGRYALTAASASARVAFAASFHGANLAPASSDGPDQRAARITGKVYVGVAGIDPTFGVDERERLSARLQEAGVDYAIEIYEGARHGFVMQDLPAGDAEAARTHWAVVERLLHEASPR